MNFVSTPPSTPGFYAWRRNNQTPQGFIALFNVVIPKSYQEIGGEWCRLVPAEEVEKAYLEGYAAGDVADNRDWANSRAKRVMEGKE